MEESKMHLIYHMTHFENLPKIIEKGGLLSRGALEAENHNFRDVGEPGIVDRRRQKSVTAEPYGVLTDYVPFYFNPESPMRVHLRHEMIVHDATGVDNLLLLITSVDRVQRANLNFVFTRNNASSFETTFLKEIRVLEEIGWFNTSRDKYSHTDSGDKQKRQAEFLIHSFVPIKSIEIIEACDKSLKNQVAKIVQSSGLGTKVR